MYRILLVDDEDLELQGLTLMIESFGLPLEICDTARNGQEGLEKAKKMRPDIVLTDLRMPQLSGIEMIHRIPCEGYTPSFIILSGYSDFEAAQAGIELGICSYLLKPVKRGELFGALRRLCPHAGSSSQPVTQEKAASHTQRPSEEENMLRHALSAQPDKALKILNTHPFGEYLDRKKIAVFSVEFSPSVSEDMYDFSSMLRHFAKETEALTPVIIDSHSCVLIFTIPAFLEEDLAVEHLSKSADTLLEEFLRLRIGEVYIGISDISAELDRLPELYKQCVTVLKKRFLYPLSHVLFFEKRELSESGSSHPNAIILHVQKFVAENYASQLNLETILEGLYLSPSYVRRLFKSHMGVTVMDYVERVRMDHAQQLLGEMQYKVQEIGTMVGYENPSYFNLVFKKYFGLTPGEYRRSILSSK